MQSIGDHVHELRINDEHETFRIIYRIDPDAIVIGEVFSKKTQETPLKVIKACQGRFKRYDAI
jgi:phage-related protein